MSTQGETKSQLSCIKRIHSFRKNGRRCTTPLLLPLDWRSLWLNGNISKTSGIGLYDWLDITAVQPSTIKG